LIQLKSAREIAIMRDAGRMVAECHAWLAERIEPGVSTKELDKQVEALIRKHGATPSFKGYNDFPNAICVAINDVICHGFAGPRLKEGDIVTIDIGAYYKGYHGDRAWTYGVGAISETAAKLLAVTEHCLNLGIAQALKGKRTGDIGHAIQTYAEGLGYGVVREYMGHGVGQALHESPSVPHYGSPNTGALLRSGLTIAIEPMITTGDWHTKLDADEWTARTVDGSLCAQYEHTIAITEHGPEILTLL
jgi:methionyl aminopeptidase